MPTEVISAPAPAPAPARAPAWAPTAPPERGGAVGRAAESARGRGAGVWSLPEVRWAALATALFLGGLVAHLALSPSPAWPAWTFFLLCYAAGGWEPGLAGLRALRAKVLDVDLLMVLAAIGAAAVGQVLDGGLLIVIFATSGALEAVATHRTAQAVRGLLDLAPERAVRITGSRGADKAGEAGGVQPRDGEPFEEEVEEVEEVEELVDATALRVGELILVRPGERIAADGHVVAGASEVDQATITGEPLPAAKRVGDAVFAGTLNGTGVLRVRCEREAAESVVARIVAMVEEAAETKARTQLYIERIEQRYSVGMVTATLLLFVIPLLAGAAFQSTLLRAMTFMIVASPCAVVLATMPPLLAAMANAGRHGVLIKSAVVMERLGTTTRVAFDKTGTLTEGTPRLAAIRVLPTNGGLGEQQLLALAAAAENPSEHPLARAIVAAARESGHSPTPADSFTAVPGQGVRARVEGRLVEIGSPAWLLTTREGQEPAAAAPSAAHAAIAEFEDAATLATITELEDGAHAATLTAIAELEDGGQTAALMRIDGVPVAVLGIADRIRPAAAGAVAAIRTLTGSAPLLLTGDNRRAADLLAGQAGIGEVRAGLLPRDKVDAVRELAARGERVLLVGDGVNDAPALAAAHIGIAMGRAGSDLALDTADAVVMRDDLATVPATIALSRRARRVVTANLAVAATIILLLAGWDLAGHLPLPLGVLGHEGSTVLVGLNGLRLLRRTAWTKALSSTRN